MFFREGLVQKYTSRGFSFFNVTRDVRFRHKDVRWVEDSQSFVVPLSPLRTYYAGSNLVDPVRLTSWTIEKSPGNRYSVEYWVMPCGQDDDVDILTVSSRKMLDVLGACARVGSPERKEFTGLLPVDGSQS